MLKAAIIDMYDGTPNLGLESIIHVIESEVPQMRYRCYDVRAKQELPDLNHDVFIFTGGPGHPLDGVEVWGKGFFALLDEIVDYNRDHEVKKFAFFICHSFQIACHHFGVGKITRREKDSFGIFPMLKTDEGQADRLFEYLPQPFYAADFRSYQVTRPKKGQLIRSGARILAMEDPDRHEHRNLAIMAVRFTPEMYGVQFHPEAYPQGMSEYFNDVKRKKQIIKHHGSPVYEEMMFHLRDPIKIGQTHRKLLPGFLKCASEYLSSPKLIAS